MRCVSPTLENFPPFKRPENYFIKMVRINFLKALVLKNKIKFDLIVKKHIIDFCNFAGGGGKPALSVI